MLDRSEKVNCPEGLETDLVAHRIMLIIASKVVAGETHISLNKGLKIFDIKGEQAVYKELDVLHLQKVFAPQDPAGLTKKERGRTLELLMFLEQKRTGAVKGRLVADGSWHAIISRRVQLRHQQS